MIKRATLIWMLLATAAGIGLFVLKYEVKSMEGQLATIHENTKTKYTCNRINWMKKWPHFI